MEEIDWTQAWEKATEDDEFMSKRWSTAYERWLIASGPAEDEDDFEVFLLCTKNVENYTKHRIRVWKFFLWKNISEQLSLEHLPPHIEKQIDAQISDRLPGNFREDFFRFQHFYRENVCETCSKYCGEDGEDSMRNRCTC